MNRAHENDWAAESDRGIAIVIAPPSSAGKTPLSPNDLTSAARKHDVVPNSDGISYFLPITVAGNDTTKLFLCAFEPWRNTLRAFE
jgi:hypothetical protein